jgi:hypothetical protein
VERRRGLGIMPLRTEALATNASAKQVALSSERDSDVAGDGRENRTAAGAHTSRRLARRGIGIPIGQCPALAGVSVDNHVAKVRQGLPGEQGRVPIMDVHQRPHHDRTAVREHDRVGRFRKFGERHR